MLQSKLRLMLAGFLLAVLLSASAGCDSPAMRDSRVTREQALTRSVHTIGNLDERRNEQLASTGRIIEDRYKLDNKLIRRDMAAIDWLFRDEFDEWTRKQPAYRRSIGHQLEGDPASIERTVPHFVY